MKKFSAGLLVYRTKDSQVEVLLGHYGGPFWAKKDKGAWTIPKGEYTDSEEPLHAAKREFAEELSLPAPEGELLELGEVVKPYKTFVAWAINADMDVSQAKSNTATVEWPPRSGKMIEVPEIENVQYFALPVAIKKIHPNLLPFLERLAEKLNLKLEAPAEPAEQPSLF